MKQITYLKAQVPNADQAHITVHIPGWLIDISALARLLCLSTWEISLVSWHKNAKHFFSSKTYILAIRTLSIVLLQLLTVGLMLPSVIQSSAAASSTRI